MNTQVDRLISIWEEASVKPTPEELCRDCPALLLEVRDQIRRLCAVNAALLESGDSDKVDRAPSEDVSESLTGQRSNGRRYPRIEGYKISAVIGKGGMGVVYRATQLATRREVALKLMTANAFHSALARRRFEREVELASALDHPNIARIYDSGLNRNIYFYAMTLVNGLPVDDFVKSNHLNARPILEVFRKVCHAVAFAHQCGVIHRDLKPSNILIQSDGEPVVVDFGLAKSMRDDHQAVMLTHEGDITGTPAFMSPEQSAGRTQEIGTASDVYALGVILFRLLLKEHPFDLSGSAIEVMRRIIDQEPTRPRMLLAKFDRDLEAILLKCLEKEPAKRYGSAQDLADDIQRFLNQEPVLARASGTGHFFRKRLAKHRTSVAAALLAFVLGSLAVAFYLWSLQSERNRTERAMLAANEQETAVKGLEERINEMAAAPAGPDPRLARLQLLEQLSAALYNTAIPALQKDCEEVQSRIDLCRKLLSSPPLWVNIHAEQIIANVEHGDELIASIRPLVDELVRRSTAATRTAPHDDAAAVNPKVIRGQTPPLNQVPQAGKPNSKDLSPFADIAEVAGLSEHERFDRLLTRFQHLTVGGASASADFEHVAVEFLKVSRVRTSNLALRRMLDELERLLAQPESSRAVNWSRLGPGQAGWSATAAADGSVVRYKPPQGKGFAEGTELVFLRIGRTSTYLQQTEMPVGLFVDLVHAWGGGPVPHEILTLVKSGGGHRRGAGWAPAGPKLKRARTWCTTTAPSTANQELVTDTSPVQCITPLEALQIARHLHCRLPTSAEWHAAVNAQGTQFKINRRDVSWKRMQETLNIADTDDPATAGPYSFFTYSTQPALAIEARKLAAKTADDEDDGFAWYAPVAAEGFSAAADQWYHLLGNVAEFVFDDPRLFEAEGHREGEQTIALLYDHLGQLGVIGGSALSTKGTVLMDLMRFDREKSNRRFFQSMFGTGASDVGFRLAYTVQLPINLGDELKDWLDKARQNVKPG